MPGKTKKTGQSRPGFPSFALSRLLPGSANKDGQSRRPGLPPLAVAWLLLLVAVSAITTYALLSDQPRAPAARPGLLLALEAEEEAAGPSETASAEADVNHETSAQSAAAGQEEPPPDSAAAPEVPEDGTAAEEAPPAQTAAVAETAPQDPEERVAEPSAAEPAESAALESPAAAEAAMPAATELDGGAVLAPWRRFAAVYDAADARPRIAVVLTGLGLSAEATNRAIRELPASITLSFTPYADRLDHWMGLARVNGHEVLLDLPMEPTTFPYDDPGPQTLLTQLDAAENRQRLRWVLERGRSYVGLAAVMGSRFTQSEPDLQPVLEEIKDRGLMFVDNQATEASAGARLARGLGLPHAVNDRMLDDGHASHVAIDARLAQIERLARANGAAVAMGRPYPATLERLRAWVRSLDDRGFVLVPITALAKGSGS